MARSVPERVSWAVEQLADGLTGRLLEVGCGPGHAVALLCERLPCSTVTAIDRSALQAARARARNQAAVAAGRVRIEQLTLAGASAVLGTGAFDAAIAINVNAFWTAPAPSLASLARLLTPRGRAYLVYEPPSASRLRAARARLPRLLGEHGFTVEDVRVTTFRASRGLCLVGRVATGAPLPTA
jgi:SAM-dependent methyltransferase